MVEDRKIMRMLDAMKDPIRMQIVFLLIKNVRTNVGGIAAQFQITRPAISHHLRVLKDAEVVTSEKKGQEVYYSANSHAIAESLRKLADRIETGEIHKRH